MKKLGFLLLAAAVAACSPQIYPLQMDVRGPSSSGIDLGKKSMAIVYMDGHNTLDSLFDRHAASAFARELEKDYFGGEEAISISRIPSADSVGLDLMHALVMETGGDVVFLLDSKVDANVGTSLYVYDSMGKDKVLRYNGTAALDNLLGEGFEEKGENVGHRIARRFLSNWKTENFSFYYFEDYSSELWYKPLQDAGDGKMASAIDGWAKIAKSGSDLKKACACYNIAQAFFLMGDYSLSSRWLDEADRFENLSLSPGLRKRLSERLEKTQK